MRITPIIALPLFAAVAVAQPPAPATTRESMVVSPHWLSQHLRDPGLVLLHVGDRAEYDREHIPGAQFAALSDFSAPMDHSGGSPHATLDVPPPAVLRALLQKLGVSDGSRVVIYWGRDRVSQATRIWFTLDHAGLGARAAVLDGGMPAWKRAGLATDADVPAARTGTLSPLTYGTNIASGEWVRDNIGKPGTFVVDARAAIFYSGENEAGPQDARRRGHIPGAASIPFTAVTDSLTVLHSADALAKLFTAAGMKPGDTVVTYCHIGQQATAVLFAARSLGYEAKLYDGSFEDWARRGWPIAVPR